MAHRLRNYDSMVHGPMQTHISAVETSVESLKDEWKKLKEEIREEIRKNNFYVAPVRTRAPEVRARCPPA